MSVYLSDPANLVGMLFNVLIMLAILGLWLLWARNMKRQKQVEALLAATSTQLEEATRHLESALTRINQLQERPDRSPDAEASRPVQVSAYRQAQATARDNAPQADKAIRPEAGAARNVQAAAADIPDDVQQIIRLHRLGMSADNIAAQLKLPLARVNLLLRLHQNRSADQAG